MGTHGPIVAVVPPALLRCTTQTTLTRFCHSNTSQRYLHIQTHLLPISSHVFLSKEKKEFQFLYFALSQIQFRFERLCPTHSFLMSFQKYASLEALSQKRKKEKKECFSAS